MIKKENILFLTFRWMYIFRFWRALLLNRIHYKNISLFIILRKENFIWPSSKQILFMIHEIWLSNSRRFKDSVNSESIKLWRITSSIIAIRFQSVTRLINTTIFVFPIGTIIPLTDKQTKNPGKNSKNLSDLNFEKCNWVSILRVLKSLSERPIFVFTCRSEIPLFH